MLDSEGKSHSPDELWSKGSAFTNAISIYPVDSMAHMHLLHYYYMSQLVEPYKDIIEVFHYIMSDTCSQLPHAMLQHEAVQAHCTVISPDSDRDAEVQIKTNEKTIYFKPKNRREIEQWQYFDAHNIYSADTIEPSTSMKGSKYYDAEVKRIIEECVKIVSNKFKTNMVFESIQNGYLRLIPAVGNEYIIDATYKSETKEVTERIRLLRRLGEQYDVKPSKSDNSEEVNVIVPVSDVTDRCFEFLSMYENAVLKKHDNVHLILVAYGQDVDKIVEKVKLLDDAKITIINGAGEFSRAKGLDLGMKFLDEDKLAFLCDVDMKIDSGFFKRCRHNTIKGKSAYFPEVFKMYNSKYFTQKVSRTITYSHGYWGTYGFGMLCVYKSDYAAAGGLNTKLTGWGSEDVQLSEKFVSSDMEIIRAPDPGLIHHWHPKHCATSSKNYGHCLGSRARDLGSKDDLAKFLYKQYQEHPELEP